MTESLRHTHLRRKTREVDQLESTRHRAVCEAGEGEGRGGGVRVKKRPLTCLRCWEEPLSLAFRLTDQRLPSEQLGRAGTTSQLGSNGGCGCVAARSRLGVGAVRRQKRESSAQNGYNAGFGRPAASGLSRLGDSFLVWSQGGRRIGTHTEAGVCGMDLPGGAVRLTGRERRSMAKSGSWSGGVLGPGEKTN